MAIGLCALPMVMPGDAPTTFSLSLEPQPQGFWGVLIYIDLWNVLLHKERHPATVTESHKPAGHRMGR